MLSASTTSYPSNPNSPTLPLNNSTSINVVLRPTGQRNDQFLNSPSSSQTSSRNYLEYIKSWNDEQVGRWLVDSKLSSNYIEIFRANDIRGNVLLDVDQQALKEMGIRSVGDRVKIVVAIKALRQRCITAAWTDRQARTSIDTNASASPPAAATAIPPVPDSQPIKRTASGRAAGRIPPPLHLSQSNSNSSHSLPQAWQPNSSTTPGSVTRSQSSSGGIAPSISPRSATGPRTIPPPSQPPPRSQPPPPPPQTSLRTNSGSLANSHTRAPSISTTAASPTSTAFVSPPTNWVGDYGLPRAPAPGNLVGGTFRNNSLPPRPPQGVAPLRPSTATGSTVPLPPVHRKSVSVGTNLSRSNPGGNSSYVSSTHPYATIPSPTTEAFGTVAYRSGSSPSKGLLPSPAIGGPLSPVSEFNSPASSSPAISPGARDVHYRNSTMGSISSLDAVMRKALKFIGEDGISKMVAVSDCTEGREVLIRVLRKFGKIPQAGEVGELEGWGIFRISEDSYSPLRVLSNAELVAICQDGTAPERQRGLVLRRIPNSTETNSQAKKRGRKLQWMFGEENTPESTLPGGVNRISPTSPNYLGVEIPTTTIEPPSPSELSSSSDESDRADFARARIVDLSQPVLNSLERGKTNRASTISVMSGLGADWGSPGQPSALAKPTINEPSTGAFLSSGRKLRNFFGQRPPSELIATHLTEYFPKAEKKLLSKQVRQSMRKSIVRRDSQYNEIATSWEKAPDRYSLSPAALSRFSGSSGGSGNHLHSHPLPLPPDAASHYPSTPPRISSIPRTSDPFKASAPSILEIDDESTEEDDTDQESYISNESRSTESMLQENNRRSSRISIISRVDSIGGWDRRSTHSDSASILTMDEVTAELETRRASLASNHVSDEEEKGFGLLRPGSIASVEEEEDEEEEDEEDEEYEEEEEAVISDVALISGKPATKWIKGALIGAGSFGSVYLGMNPMNGSLMAVKQVELPTGHSHNEERKKSMLDALEREIELLKVLQHENIVQYLDSSSDATHLNIFLEYVPGGSVAALLSNYGAFEEALVSKFVRQILTGLEYLHKREIIHRDIKGANILVDNKGGIKISDFGISKKVEDNLLASAHRPSLQGSVYWMAPEVVKQTSYTSKADIWSLGCLVVEMLTGAHPWANLTQMQAIFRIGSSSAPTIPEDISIEADDFLEQTFMIDHNQRPSAIELLQTNFVRDLDAPNNLSQATPTRATFLG